MTGAGIKETYMIFGAEEGKIARALFVPSFPSLSSFAGAKCLYIMMAK
jgi:hypothetical protein